MCVGLYLTAKLNLGLVVVWGSLLAFYAVQLVGVVFHYLRLGPLSHRQQSAAAREVECVIVPQPGGAVEVCAASPQPPEEVSEGART